MLDSWRTSVDDWGSVNQARGLNNRGLVLMVVNHQGGVLLDRLHLSLVVVFLYIIVQVQSHHMGPGCLWHVVHLGPDGRFRNNKGCFSRVHKGCFGHSKSWRHHHPWSLIYQPTSLLVNNLNNLTLEKLFPENKRNLLLKHLDTVWSEDRGRLLVARVFL